MSLIIKDNSYSQLNSEFEPQPSGNHTKEIVFFDSIAQARLFSPAISRVSVEIKPSPTRISAASV